MGTVDDMLDRHERNKMTVKRDMEQGFFHADFSKFHGINVPSPEEYRNKQIERLARALLFDNYYGNYDEHGDVWDDVSEPTRIDCRKRATAMLDYMDSLEVE